MVFMETIRDACAQMVEKNGDVIASAGGNFPAGWPHDIDA